MVLSSKTLYNLHGKEERSFQMEKKISLLKDLKVFILMLF